MTEADSASSFQEAEGLLEREARSARSLGRSLRSGALVALGVAALATAAVLVRGGRPRSGTPASEPAEVPEASPGPSAVDVVELFGNPSRLSCPSCTCDCAWASQPNVCDAESNDGHCCWACCCSGGYSNPHFGTAMDSSFNIYHNYDRFVQMMRWKGWNVSAAKAGLQPDHTRCMREQDCNRDGQKDCGKYTPYDKDSNTGGGCANPSTCEWRYRVFKCLRPGNCCVCRPTCSVGTADVDSTGVYNYGHWSNWGAHIQSCAPWTMPTNDQELVELLQYAKDQGYKVRPSGAAHSAGGLVTSMGEPGVVVVSLARYVAPGAWEYELNKTGALASVTVNAGWTQLQLMAKIRPLNYFLPSCTAGYFFQLGGIVANSVHGGVYNAGFIFEYVTRMRVMLHDGTIKILDQESDLRMWRNSYGLLGIILGLEFKLVARPKLQIYTTPQKSLSAWTEKDFWEYINVQGSANLPHNATGQPVPQGSKEALSGEFFLRFGETSQQMLGVVSRANDNADEPGYPNTAPDNVVQNYVDLMEARVVDENRGWMPYGASARRSGAPPLQISLENRTIQFGPGGVVLPINDIFEAIGEVADGRITSTVLAKLLSYATVAQTPLLVESLQKLVNDGFWLTQSPVALISAWFVSTDKAFEAMDFLRREQLASLRLRNNGFKWNQPGEFRFITVGDTAELQAVPPGTYFNSEFLSFPDVSGTDQDWKQAFKRVQDYWVHKLGARPHLGKLWGFEKGPDGKVEPFADSYACLVYSNATKAKFEAYRVKTDPDGLFATGLGMKLLAPCKKEPPAS